MRLALALSTLLLFWYATPSAQVFYQYPGAPTIEARHIFTGAYLSAGDDLFRFGGYGRYGVAKYWDFGVEGLFDRSDDAWRGGLGGDLKYQLFPTTSKLPFDLSLNGGIGFENGAGVMTLQAPIGGIISTPLTTDGGQVITPYLGVYAVWVRTEVDQQGLPDWTDNDIDALIRGGAKLQLKVGLEIFATLQLGPSDLVSIGVNYEL